MARIARVPRQFNALDLGGGTRLYWLDGGGFRLDGGAMFGPVPRGRWMELYPPAEDNSVPLTAYVVLVERTSAGGSSWGLLDSGFGHHLSDRQRRAYSLERESQLEQALAELGLSTRSIDWIVLSHLHLDHAGGVLARDDQSRVTPVFPNAPIWVQRLEAQEARDASNRAHGMYTGAAFDGLEQLGLIREVDGDADIAPGIRVFLTGGHSRGHQVTLIQSPPPPTATSSGARASLQHPASTVLQAGTAPPDTGLAVPPMGAEGQREGEAPPRAGAAAPDTASARPEVGDAAPLSGGALLHMGDLLVTHAHLSPAWVSALDDFPLDSIRAKRHWLPRAAEHGWWVAFSHDVTATAGLLDAEARLRTALRPDP
jgi:glyoxylase-like metal-dependent hydrolase (beta-lactamase superfamily II)